MAKFVTQPNLGTRKITFPVLGIVEIKEGIVEIPDDKVEEVLSLDFGVKLFSEDGFVANKSAASGKSESENEISGFTIQALKRDMPRVADLKEAFENLRQFASEEEIENFEKSKKDEMYPIILALLNKAQEVSS